MKKRTINYKRYYVIWEVSEFNPSVYGDTPADGYKEIVEARIVAERMKAQFPQDRVYIAKSQIVEEIK